jgi:large subunit ribosomal protein L9|tara:strand:+ start:611 stop:1186 length:576 start_codon:yes stop_codon:yes gene_type:complete
MQIILLERVAKLGQMGEVVNVKDGYARNFLLPQGKGLRVNAANLARFEAEKAALEARNVETRTTAQADADKIDGETFVIIRSASDSGSLYGSVTPRDVADAGAEHGFKIDRNQVVLQGPIKDLGLHDVMLNLHPEVTAMVTLNIARSKDEAELQAAGKSIQELAAEEEAAAEFEIQELFDDLGAASNDDDE